MPHLGRGDAEELMDRAHQRSPYSNVIWGNVDVTLSVAAIPAARSAG
jgi:organic hydroperoxide reductase OsmC/OhrA